MNLEELIEELFYNEKDDQELLECLKEKVEEGTTGKDIDALRYSGFPFLCLAIDQGYLETAKYLINLGCDINLQDEDGWTPLMYASFCNYIDIVTLLLSKNVDVNVKNNYGKTALIFACKSNYPVIVELLLKYGADSNIKNSDGRTILINACLEGNIEIVKMLIKYGANANIIDNYGKSACDYAAKFNAGALCEILEHGSIDEESADIDLKSDEEVKTAVSKLAKRLRGV